MILRRRVIKPRYKKKERKIEEVTVNDRAKMH